MYGTGNASKGAQLMPAFMQTIMHEVSRLIRIVKPFLLWPVLIGGMILVRMMWHSNAAVVTFFAVAAVALSLLVIRFSNSKPAEILHGIFTLLTGAAIIDYTDMVGRTQPVMFISLIGIPVLCLSWSIVAACKTSIADAEDNLALMFDRAGMGNTRMKLHPVIPGTVVKKIRGTFNLPPGSHSIEDATKRMPQIESGLRFPPGAVTITPHEGNASLVNFTISDPRILNEPIIWPGASHPHASIAEPLRIGIWQDNEDCELSLLDTHFQIMGMTGSGKSLGAFWNFAAEIITRSDAALMVADITKGTQTVAPLANSLYRVETERAGAKQMLVDVYSSIKPRTDYLAEKGLAKWQPGCGLTYLVVWLEEAPDIIDTLGKAGVKRFLSSLKAARSAGITFVLSLQRSSWDQMPTLARGQLAKMCFGLAQASDAKFGLSETQIKREVNPAIWNRRYPGKAYLDAPGMDDDHVAMPMRCYFWGNDTKLIADFAAKYSRVTMLDEVSEPHFTARATSIEDVADVEDVPEVVVPDVTKPDPIRTWVINNGHEPFSATDFVYVVAKFGLSRKTAFNRLNRLVSDGLLVKDSGNYVLCDNLRKARNFIRSSKERAPESIDPNLTPEDLLPLYEQADCSYCNLPIQDNRQIDHMTPLARGGMTTLSNLCAACSHCNESKGDMTAEEFREKLNRS